MKLDQLKNAQCEPCQGGVSALNDQEVEGYLSSINPAWRQLTDKPIIIRTFKFKSFSKTMFFVNALAYMADQQGHHPDVEFGYNYCKVKFTTHEAGGLTVNDFICAKKVDNL